MATYYYQHKFKCLTCSLHFIVCSDYEKWPDRGTTREQRVGEATGQVFCPECGQTGPMLHFVQEVDGFIFESVPGKAELRTVRA